ncbi:ATP-binding protein [Halopseudomonas phragmitis]|uniref:histidine kinase n=2 Tax=Pseudomonadaceae TaxID=135621 RepID=A0A1V0B5Z7_9GAMM|nr:MULTISPECIES: ATP-binding protein [Pseudomonadaceae]AQZ95345.1 hybrid sensor histidine kinase/response regulator [Halopseudomonas phragmitis]RHW20131.1 hybrid sensor histidine kinase/response regulator [Pseudomonas jilinensis]
MNIRFTDRLSFKQARLGVLAAFILGILLGLIQVLVDYHSEDAAIDREVQAQINVSLGPASRIAYNIDAELALELVNGLLQAPPVVRAEIIDSNGVALASVSRPMASSRYRAVSDALFERRRDYSQPLFVEHVTDELLGHLVIEVDTFHQGASFLRRAGLTMLSGFILSLVLSLILMVLFYAMLTKPLVRLIIDLLNMKAEEERSRLPCPDGHERDEIGALVEVINHQLQSIDVSMRQKLRAEERLRQYLEELESIVEARTTELQETNAQLRLSNQELELSREEALDMARARSVFLANMSHEIRTPINGLLGMIGLTLDSPLNDEQRQQLSIAYDSGKVLVELLNDILDLSKFEAGKLQLEHIAFDLGALLEDTASLLSQNAGKQDIELTCQIDPQLPGQMYGDPTRIRQIASNLLSNALKFTENGHVSLRLRLDTSDSRQQWVHISVADTGIGIAEHALDSIFSPFTQADVHISRRFGGTGLGLALCKSLSDAMGGRLQVISVPEQGSTFTVSLPLETAQNEPSYAYPTARKVVVWNQQGRRQGSILKELLCHWGMNCELLTYTPDDEPPQHPCLQADVWLLDSPILARRLGEMSIEIPRMLICPYPLLLPSDEAKSLNVQLQVASPPARARLARAIDELFDNTRAGVEQERNRAQETGQHILLVEDNMVNQMVARGMLSRLGYQVDVAEHGEAALNRLEQQGYDLVLMDCNMPVLDGYETSRRMRTDPRWQKIPVIALTANALQEDRQRCEAAGMNDYLAKPFKREDLQALLEKWLGRH